MYFGHMHEGGSTSFAAVAVVVIGVVAGAAGLVAFARAKNRRVTDSIAVESDTE